LKIQKFKGYPVDVNDAIFIGPASGFVEVLVVVDLADKCFMINRTGELKR